MSEFFSRIGRAITGTLNDGLQAILYNTIYKLLYYIETGLCWILKMVYSMFEVLAGLTTVSYDGEKDYLINIFFNNSAVSNVYWGIAVIGIALSFVFAIIAVARKAADSGERIGKSLGGILTGLVKSILIIGAMSAVMVALIDSSNILMQRVSYVFDHSDDLSQPVVMTYTDEEYAAMARVLNTVGNYSLNSSYQSRYNINSCYNELRRDMQYLDNQGVFDVYYVTTDSYGNKQLSWQSVLQDLARSADLSRDLSMDVYNESVSNSILGIMDVLRSNAAIYPLKSYQRTTVQSSQTVPLDRLIFLTGTMDAARNTEANQSPSITDSVRGPYYTGDKDIYDLASVNADFDIGTPTHYLLVYLCACVAIWNLGIIIFNCIARIFNMLLLYVISPPIAAVTPLDDGAKLKQWVTAMVTQCFGVFGTVIAMRLLLLFIPIVLSPKLVLFENADLNLFCKMVIILGGTLAVQRASGMITGILADSAGMQAIHSSDLGGAARAYMGGAMGMAAKAPAVAWGAAGAAAGVTAAAARGVGAAAGGVGSLAGMAASAIRGRSGGSLPDKSGPAGGADPGPGGTESSASASGGSGSGADGGGTLPPQSGVTGGADPGPARPETADGPAGAAGNPLPAYSGGAAQPDPGAGTMPQDRTAGAGWYSGPEGHRRLFGAGADAGTKAGGPQPSAPSGNIPVPPPMPGPGGIPVPPPMPDMQPRREPDVH